ncbi:unnamed protein product [Xylocopa violacea]|uniref:Cilia- and flagella-associated protein 69 ARM repeats domain-containing protein n=1 Tax=Xylocopa violacea TaxID=135666 RepID=A0ABP1PGQ7_XYLVO
MEQNKSRMQSSNKSGVTDVWKEFHCPIYVNHHCPKTDKLSKVFNKEIKLDTNQILQKLDTLMSDPIASDSVIRICKLLYDYLDKVGDNGYKIKDLPLVIKVLKFLADRVKSVKEYELHLNRMLELCNIPPLLERPSEASINSDIMEQYFTLLGQLLVILPTKRQVLNVHKALYSLLLKTRVKYINAIKVEYCHKAMEKSMLPVTVVKLVQASHQETYPTNLELVFLLSSVSCACSHRMLEANVLNTILIRMDLPYATQLRCTRPPDIPIPGNEYNDDTTLLIINTLWSLLRSITFPNTLPSNLKENLSPSHCALWGLCYAFERQIWHSQYRSFNIHIRNEIAAIILTILVTFPSWNLVSSGIADTTFKYLIGVESGTVRVFSEIIKFSRSIEDLYFEKILLFTVMHLAEVDACILLMVQRRLMETILQMINPSTVETKISWNVSQFWDLWSHAMNVLSILAPKMPKEFMKYDGSTRLYVLLEWCLDTNINVEIITTCMKTICIIILSDNIYLLECFREYGIILLLIKLINNILKWSKMTMREQRLLTLALISTEKLMEKQTFYQEIYGDHSVTFIMELLFRCLYQKDQEYQIDQRLLLAIGSYIWKCIVWNFKSLEKFIQYGAVYIILDTIEIAPYYSRCLFLAILTDMCDNFFCGPFLCTWRGIDKKTGLMSLLANIWREEEIRLEVKRNVDGTVKDEELPQMGNKQWLDTYCIKLDRGSSPAMTDMIGSVRSKIYSIFKIIERDNERYKMAKKHYKILYGNLSMEDRITVSTIELYFALKLGQVWIEVSKYFEQVGITPLGMDGQALFLMMQRYYLWGSLAKERQNRIIQSIEKEEEIEEKDEYAAIRDARLVLALDAFDELEYIYRTTDRSYMLKKKYEQIRQVNSALKFPRGSDAANCFRTFQNKPMVTAIFNQYQTISSDVKSNSHLSYTKLQPVSISSFEPSISDERYSILSAVSLSSTCLPRMEEFDKNE